MRIDIIDIEIIEVVSEIIGIIFGTIKVISKTKAFGDFSDDVFSIIIIELERKRKRNYRVKFE